MPTDRFDRDRHARLQHVCRSLDEEGQLLHHYRLARRMPKDRCLPVCVGQIQVPPQRAGRGNSREIGHVYSRAADESVDLPLSEHSIETRDVGPG